MEKRFLDTQEIAAYLGVNEKQVYTLIHERGLPATKITGKWLFSRHLVDRWLETSVANVPTAEPLLRDEKDLLLIAGSDDPLFTRLIALYRRRNPEVVTLRSRAGSGDGLLALRKGLVHIACVHLMDPEGGYSSRFLRDRLGDDIAVVAFAVRTQGLFLPPGNPLGIEGISDAACRGHRWAVREVGTGTRALMDRELDRLDIDLSDLISRSVEREGHMETALAVLTGRADIGLGVQAAATLTGCSFIPLRQERFKMIIRRENFFMPQVQGLLDLLREEEFREMAASLEGYETVDSGKVLME